MMKSRHGYFQKHSQTFHPPLHRESGTMFSKSFGFQIWISFSQQFCHFIYLYRFVPIDVNITVIQVLFHIKRNMDKNNPL